MSEQNHFWKEIVIKKFVIKIITSGNQIIQIKVITGNQIKMITGYWKISCVFPVLSFVSQTINWTRHVLYGDSGL